MVWIVLENPLPPVNRERDDGLSAEVIFLKEGIMRHGLIRVSVGISKENRIIAVQIFNLGGQFRSCILHTLVVRKFQQRSMAARIFLNGLNAEQLSSDFLLNQLGSILVISKDLFACGHTAGAGHRIHSVCFLNGEIRNQDMISGRTFSFR